jgi:hypothetical protein
MKLVLEKEWQWNDQVLMYFDDNRPEMVNFPFWWYHIENRNIKFIKQVSKTFGVVFAENRWIPEVEDIGILTTDLKGHYNKEDYDSDTINELERRSWITLGQFVVDDYPNESLIEYPGGGGAIFKFHPMTKKILEVTQIDSDGIIFYNCKVEFEETNVEGTNEKRLFKSKSTVYNNLGPYASVAKKDTEWQKNKNGEWRKDWLFYELENFKLVKKYHKKL